jgi:RNA polymerase sigma-70 factor (ECF subfamily)
MEAASMTTTVHIGKKPDADCNNRVVKQKISPEQLREQTGKETMPSIVDESSKRGTSPGTLADGETDEALVAAAKTGDERALATLINRHQLRIFAVAQRYTKLHEDAEDMVQQTFQKAFVNLHKFQGKSSFSTWLTRIAINESLMFLRRGRAARKLIDNRRSEDASSRELEILDSSPNPEMSYLQQETVHVLFSAMAQLSPTSRIAMELKELRELSGSDTARHLGVSLSAVKARVFHGRKKLRQILKDSTTSPRRSGCAVLGITRNNMSNDRLTSNA